MSSRYPFRGRLRTGLVVHAADGADPYSACGYWIGEDEGWLDDEADVTCKLCLRIVSQAEGKADDA